MSVARLKIEIIKKLNAIEDEIILAEILKLMAAESALQRIYKLSDDEVKAIKEGVADIDEGRVYSCDAARIKVSEWVKK